MNNWNGGSREKVDVHYGGPTEEFMRTVQRIIVQQPDYKG